MADHADYGRVNWSPGVPPEEIQRKAVDHFMDDVKATHAAEYERGTTPRFYVTPEALGSWADYAQRHVSSDDWEGTLARALLTLVSAYQWARDWPDEQSDGCHGSAKPDQSDGSDGDG